ncbi:MAG: ATP-binding protein DrrA1-3 family domain-containing protein, partial [Cellulosimicrobium funkei]
GKVNAEGTATELKRSVGEGAVHLRLADATQRGRAAEVVGALLGTDITLANDPYAFTARVPDDGAADVARILPALGDEGIVVPEFTLGQPSLDEVFLALTGQPMDDDETIEEVA